MPCPCFLLWSPGSWSPLVHRAHTNAVKYLMDAAGTVWRMQWWLRKSLGACALLCKLLFSHLGEAAVESGALHRIPGRLVFQPFELLWRQLIGLTCLNKPGLPVFCRLFA